jgi:hypothetical protein
MYKEGVKTKSQKPTANQYLIVKAEGLKNGKLVLTGTAGEMCKQLISMALDA